MSILLACLAALVGYYLWQRSRYEPRLPQRAASVHAAADAAALALIIGFVWIGGTLAADWGFVAHQGLPGATIGAIIGVLLADPLRRAILRGSRNDRPPRS